jgi:putative FmdB family regulatory protein
VPLYEYECLKCSLRTEKIESVSGPHLKKCPDCGGKVEMLISAPAIQFKGSGWYVTDYAGKSKNGGGEKPATENKDAGKESTTKESAKESAAKESTAKEAPAKEKKTTATKK